ncbi:PP2C family protein-serine/threonine phosphatase [Arenivirga flava]|uniref:PPM-type phosphatase domain-containing protein n=1 Tax=Arenivirga flava TaxID=1930060 RepID=A0AA37UIZ5_9MICO|nr:protein phosphatase 2C domain-containing protein [Arenivirga flava]GMA27800.1 hypothetical protein GCM10025874_10530 [Arenivirga flava]
MLQLGEASGTVPVPVEGGPALALSWHALTDVGHRRSLNEDSLVAMAPVFAVADGMGGHDSGDVASAAVVRRLGELASDGLTSIDEITAALARATLDIHDGEIAGGRGSGTTVTGAALVAEEGTPTSPSSISVTPASTPPRARTSPASRSTTRSCRPWSTPA